MSSELHHVLKLLDDPDASVKRAIADYVDQFDGDLSEEIAGEAITLSRSDKKLLSNYLLPGRRKCLAANWQIPDRFHNTMGNDWETFEFLLSLLSDYLHDGLTLRPSLYDSLDQLADEVHLADSSNTAEKLGHFLFQSSRFMGNNKNYFAKENSDINWVIHHTVGNPISLVVIYMLIAQRFGLSVHGCNYPGHFLAWVDTDQKPYLVDAYNRSRVLHPHEIMGDNPQLSENAKQALSERCSLKTIILRILNNIEGSYMREGLESEAPFLQRLKKSVHPTPVS